MDWHKDGLTQNTRIMSTKAIATFHQKDLNLSNEVGQGDLERIHKGIEAVSVDSEQVVL